MSARHLRGTAAPEPFDLARRKTAVGRSVVAAGLALIAAAVALFAVALLVGRLIG